MPEKGVSVRENASLSTLNAMTTTMIMFTDPPHPPHARHRCQGLRVLTGNHSIYAMFSLSPTLHDRMGPLGSHGVSVRCGGYQPIAQRRD